MSFLRNPNNRLRLTGYAVLIVGAAVVLTFGLLSIYRPASASSSVARTATVGYGTVAESVSASGNVSPENSDSVNFATGGTLTAVDVAVGDTVKAGQVLAKIDPTDAEDDLQAAEDSLQVAESALADAEAGGTSAELEQDKASLTSAQIQLRTDQQQLSTDQSTLSQAQSQLSSDQRLGCPAASSSQSTSPSSTSSDSSDSSDDSGSTGTGSSGSGDDSSGSDDPQASSDDATTTAHTKPSVTTGSASEVATTTATLEATVDPGGLSTKYYFEYGSTDGYGLQTASGSVSGSSPVQVTTQVSGLQPDTGYIFRVVATNSLGDATGLGVAFTTADSSCVAEQQTITSDTQTVQRDEAEIGAQEQSIAATEAGDAPNSSTILQDESQVLEDQETVASDQKTAAETTLTAPMSGTVTAVDGQVGDTVSGGGSSASSDTSNGDNSDSSDDDSGSAGSTGTSSSSATSSSSDSSSSDDSNSSSSDSDSSSDSSSSFITIDDLSNLQVVAGFAEADAVSIAVGQAATATLAALPDTEVAGTVAAVAPTPTVTSDVVTYDVTIDLHGVPSTVKDGMTADVSIIVNIARNVLEVPNAAVTTVGSTSTVQLVQGTSTVTRDVTIGLVGESETQITSGLQAGDKVREASTTSTGSTGTSGSTGSSPFGGGGGFFGGGGLGGR